MKIVANLYRQYPQVKILKTISKQAAKKPDKEQILLKQAAQKQDTGRVAEVATLCKLAFVSLVLKDTVRLRQSERLKNKEQISYNEKIGDFEAIIVARVL